MGHVLLYNLYTAHPADQLDLLDHLIHPTIKARLMTLLLCTLPLLLRHAWGWVPYQPESIRAVRQELIDGNFSRVDEMLYRSTLPRNPPLACPCPPLHLTHLPRWTFPEDPESDEGLGGGITYACESCV